MTSSPQHPQSSKARWVSVYRYKTVWEIRIWSWKFSIKKRVPKRIRAVEKALKSGYVGKMYGVKFWKTSDL